MRKPSANAMVAGSQARKRRERRLTVRLPRSLLIYPRSALTATIALALGFLMAPWIEARSSRSWRWPGTNGVSVSTTIHDLPSATNASTAVVDTATLTQLEQLAEKGNPVAQNVLGLRYATGEGVRLDERAAARWFTKSRRAGERERTNPNWALFTGWAAVYPRT